MKAMREFEIFEISHSLHSSPRYGSYKSSFYEPYVKNVMNCEQM